ncbi:hypothetical protein [uncultured Aliiroseovarius sp.]|uniref:hypothetical protein n=1 Tax=uncultured Aliiroseovarius sp. TaxID=1658783 RepID=UPI002631334F|nr:hypothetical protein [uncultured Aliiroseovarius sp.]
MKLRFLFVAVAVLPCSVSLGLADDVRRVPANLIGMPDVLAFEVLDTLGISYQVSHSGEVLCPDKAQFSFVHDAVPPVGTVLDSDMPLIVLFTRPGEPTIPAPQVVGLSVDEARGVLQRSGFQMNLRKQEAFRDLGMKCTYLASSGYDEVIDAQEPLPLAPSCPRSTIAAIDREKTYVARATDCIEY